MDIGPGMGIAATTGWTWLYEIRYRVHVAKQERHRSRPTVVSAVLGILLPSVDGIRDGIDDQLGADISPIVNLVASKFSNAHCPRDSLQRHARTATATIVAGEVRNQGEASDWTLVVA